MNASDFKITHAHKISDATLNCKGRPRFWSRRGCVLWLNASSDEKVAFERAVDLDIISLTQRATDYIGKIGSRKINTLSAY